jgi:hypothetical protein
VFGFNVVFKKLTLYPAVGVVECVAVVPLLTERYASCIRCPLLFGGASLTQQTLLESVISAPFGFEFVGETDDGQLEMILGRRNMELNFQI